MRTMVCGEARPAAGLQDGDGGAGVEADGTTGTDGTRGTGGTSGTGRTGTARPDSDAAGKVLEWVKALEDCATVQSWKGVREVCKRMKRWADREAVK